MGRKPSGGSAEPPLDIVARRVRTLPRRLLAESVNGLAADWELRIGDDAFTVSIADHACTVRDGGSLGTATVITTDADTWLSMDAGAITGIDAFLDRRLHVSGNLDLAVRFQTLFKPFRRAARATDMRQLDVEADGIRLSCYEAGSGPPLLLLHGLGGSKISWLPLIGPLAHTHRLVVPDLPGHGESEKPRIDYSARSHARTVRHLMDAMEMDRAIVIGNSMGGRIALELALRSPKRVEALALLDPAVPGLRWRYLLGLTRVFPTEFGALSFPLRRRWMELVVRRLFADPDSLPPDAVAAAASEFIRIYAEPAARTAFLASLRALVTERPGPFWASMRRIRQPALVIIGDHDRLVPPRLGARLGTALPDAELVVLPGVGHVPQFEATEATLMLLRPFITGRPATPARAAGAS